MGVKHFWIWLKNTYGNNIRTISRTRNGDAGIDVDVLAIDMNGIIHNCAQRIFKYGNYASRRKRLLIGAVKPTPAVYKKVYEAVCESVEFYRKMVGPKKRLLLCVDGVAGLSKMSQQRQRRFKAAKENSEMIFDPNCITPGTRFLDELTSYMDWYIHVQVSMNPDWQSLTVILSNEKAPGEGEHKIINYLRRYRSRGESCCIHGADADLIMLGLACPCRDIYIFREDSFRPDDIHIVDISAIRKQLMKRTAVAEPNHRLLTDFVLLCYTVGNDFLPQVPGIEILQGGIDSLLHVYNEILEDAGYLATMYKGKLRINKRNFLLYLTNFAELEEDLINGKLQKKDCFFEDLVLDSASGLDANGKLCIDLEKYKKKYYAKKFPMGTNLQTICIEYIRGMQWVLNYYTTGTPSWSWNYPYDYAPFISDVVSYLPRYTWKEFKPDLPVLPFQQLMSVLPEKSSGLLPPQIAGLMGKESPLASFFPDDFEVDVGGKRKEWEGVVLLPKVDMVQFTSAYEAAVASVSRQERRRNVIGKSFSYSRSNITRSIRSKYGNLPTNTCARKVIVL